MEEKERTISYLRACWPEGIQGLATLQEALADCLRALPDAPATQLELRDGHAEVRHRRLQSARLGLHIAAWTAGEPVSTVPHATGVDVDLSSEPPGRDWDYLDGDGMVLVSKNHCLLMLSGLRASSMEKYLRKLLEHGREKGVQIPKEMDNFRLIATANREVAQQVYHEGVKKIHFNVGLYGETVRETIVKQLRPSLWDLFLKNEIPRRRIEDAANVTVELVIKLDARRSGLSPEDLVPLARRAVEENEDDVVIETAQGQRIRKGDLVLKTKVRVKAFAKTVHHNDAWDKMAEYFQYLESSGMLEE